MNDPDVCVLGAGPAGAALAARLARLGIDVVLVERQPFPRPKVGESLGPGIWPLLERLGVRERVVAAGFVRSPQARVRWRGDEGARASAGDPAWADGLTVARDHFDEILLDDARAAGATILRPASAGRPRRLADGWELPLRDGRVLRPRLLADATGRRRILGGSRTLTSPPMLALHAVWQEGGSHDRPQTRVDVLDRGWLWGAHLPGGQVRAMAFVDPATVSAAGRDRERLYAELLGASPMFAELLADARPAGPVRACDATSYLAAEPVDANTVKVGEAAFAIDPLSSSGVQVAIQGALAAAAVVRTVLAPEGDTRAALRYYGDLVTHTSERHAATAGALYAEHETHARSAFWCRRSTRSGNDRPAGPRPARLGELLPLRVRLVADTALDPVPCLVGDGIELRRALAHPGLDRPVAFLAGAEIAPLLDALHAAPSLGQAVSAWDRALSAGRGQQIAAWLARRGLVEARPGH